MDVELRHLRSFLAVAAELHFGRAAEELGMAQPALSQQIQRLEAAVGTPLLTRTSRRVALTPAGVALRERSGPLLRQAARDLDEVRRVGRGEGGRIDVGFVSSVLSLGHEGPVERVQRFRRRRPDVQVELHEGFTDDLLDRVGRGEIDVAAVRDPEERPELETRQILSEPYVAVVSQRHRLARATEVAGADLAGEAFVFFPAAAGALAHERNLAAVTAAGRRPDVVQEASTWATILHLVGSGLGVTVAPSSATRPAPSTVRVLALTGAGSEVCSTVSLVVRRDRPRPLLADFLDAA